MYVILAKMTEWIAVQLNIKFSQGSAATDWRWSGRPHSIFFCSSSKMRQWENYLHLRELHHHNSLYACLFETRCINVSRSSLRGLGLIESKKTRNRDWIDQKCNQVVPCHSTPSLKFSCKSVQPFSRNLANKETKKERNKQRYKQRNRSKTIPRYQIYRGRGNNHLV